MSQMWSKHLMKEPKVEESPDGGAKNGENTLQQKPKVKEHLQEELKVERLPAREPQSVENTSKKKPNAERTPAGGAKN